MAQRMNVNVSDDIKAWLEAESKKTGLPQSTIILMGLKTYVDQQRMLEMNLKIDQYQLQANKGGAIS